MHTLGLPSRVCTDRGGENVEVASYMLQHPLWDPGRGSFITGRSVQLRGCGEIFFKLRYLLLQPAYVHGTK